MPQMFIFIYLKSGGLYTTDYYNLIDIITHTSLDLLSETIKNF